MRFGRSSRLQCPDFRDLFPTLPAKADEQPLPQFNLGVGDVPILVDNTMRLPWTPP